MPKGSNSETVHFDFRGRFHNKSTSTISSADCDPSARDFAEFIGNAGSVKDNHPFSDRVYSNIPFDSNKALILSKFFNTNCSGSDSHPAYENLCSGCGYGVFEARGALCNFCQYVLNGCPEDNANIYENICDKCSQLFTGDECLVCLGSDKHTRKYDNDFEVDVKTSSKKKLKKRFIHSLLGSLKRVKSFNASTPQATNNLQIKSPNRKLQIVHNVDGFENVFCTNETFDLNRMCELKQQQKNQSQLKASTSDHHIYGKLRISEDDRHLHQARFESIKQKSQSDDYLIGGIASVDSCGTSTSIFCSHDSLNNNSSLSSCLHLRNSVGEWMTSLRRETHDYYSFGAPDTVLSNPKSIPGNFSEFCASSFVFYPRHIVYPTYDQMQHHTPPTSPPPQATNESESSQVEFTQQMVNEFKRNLMKKPGLPLPHSLAYQQHLKTKRHGIHLKLDDIETIQREAKNNPNPSVTVDVAVSVSVDRDNLVRLVGDQQQQRNDNNNYLLQPSAQAQAIALAAASGLDSGRREPEHQFNKRCCIYEKDSDFVSDILQHFDSILQRESQTSPSSSFSSASSSLPSLPTPLTSTSTLLSASSSSTLVPSQQQQAQLKNCENIQVVNNEIFLDSNIVVPHSTSDSNTALVSTQPHNINIEQILSNLVLSKSLNKIVISYNISLKIFLSALDKSPNLSHLAHPKLKKLFRRFEVVLCKQKLIGMKENSSDCLRGSGSEARSLDTQTGQQMPAIKYTKLKPKRKAPPPPVPTRGIDSLNSTKMTIPNKGMSNTKAEDKVEKEEKEEPIYQPIWKFKTLGEVQETDITDEYFENHHHLPLRCDSLTSLIETERANIEDHDEWEPDDEFTFTTKLDIRASGTKEADTISVNTIQSSSGSTITGYASSVSTMTLASTTSSATGVGNFTHHLFRNICIFYSPKYPKLRAIVYEYDRNRCSSYFALPPPLPPLPLSASPLSSSPLPPFIKNAGRGSANGSTTPTTTTSADFYDSQRSPCDGNKYLKKSSESGSRLLADSVQAWKYLLLDVNYLEDEEDMIVSESQILKAQTIKEMDTPQPQVGVLQRFKSISSGNLLDIPAHEDKKSIAEIMRNKFQKGVLKIQKSPKEGKKNRKQLKGNEATSLYLEDGIKPKYPIFKAPLELLEMNENSYPDVPRFVVDCIEYIEQKDCIQMDGLYRASGNKLAIDELKQKLTDSYIYDPKLLITDDIHTLTSLLKMFFRELGSPLIPHDTYRCFPSTKNLMDPSAIADMKRIFQSMKNPNRETLKFLIKHLTTVAHYSSENRMPASNLAIVWGPCILAANQIEFDIARMNTIAKVLIENYDQIFGDNERLVS